MHYVKGTARGGQVFRLLAVFEDGKHDTASGGHSNASATNKSGSSSISGANTFREKEKGRYAQLLNENRQVVYVSLTTKGKFYELEPSTPQIFQKPESSSKINQPKTLNTECVHRIGQLLADAAPDLPITIRYIAGPQGTTSVIPDLLTVTKITTEHILVACPIEETECRSPLHLRKLPVVAEMQFIKCLLGYENEQKMFLSQNVQNILKFCQLSVENFLRMVEMEHLQPINGKHSTYNGTKTKSEGLKILKPLNFPRLLRREKSMIAHEKEDSIIFLSKNDLENLDNKRQQPAEKMKVFQSTKKKQWFRSKSVAKVSQNDVDLDAQTKRMSMDRFQDMSKLLHERFGSNDTDPMISIKPTGGPRPSSEIGVNHSTSGMGANDISELRQKSMSLQDMDTRSSAASCVPISRPDLVPVDIETVSDLTVERTDNESTGEDRSLISFSNHQSFISEKLLNEFHVKTKQHSKSSSHLHNLLHFSVPQKMNISETPPRKATQEVGSKPEGAIVLPPFEYSQMSIEDEMPYSNVRDTLIDAANNASQQPLHISGSRSVDFVQPENIYAEICAEAVQPVRHEIVSVMRSTAEARDRNAISSSIVNGGAGSTIRISVAATTPPQSLDTVFVRPSTSSIRRHDSFVMDNIYNTLK